ncbi:unnamed protein product, partial [Brenthis ino]
MLSSPLYDRAVPIRSARSLKERTLKLARTPLRNDAPAIFRCDTGARPLRKLASKMAAEARQNAGEER